VLVGLAPAAQAVRVNVLDALGAGIAGTRPTRARLRHWIVMPQLALSLVLLVLAAVHVRALRLVETSNLGYATDGAMVFRIGLFSPRSITAIMRLPDEVRKPLLERERARASAFARATIDRVSEVPGVDVAALTSRLPFQPYFAGPEFVVGSGSPERVDAAETGVSGEYFAAMRIRLLSGRVFDTRDILSATGVAVISRSVERRLWPLGGAVGKTITFERDLPPGVWSVRPPERLEVIGVVDDVRPVLGSTAEQPLVYRFVMQEGGRQIRLFNLNSTGLLVVRARGDRATVIPLLKQVITGADALAEISNIQTTEQIVGEILYARRVGAAVLASAGLVGLMLAALGIYGLMSYSVAQRQRELGIRTSLGAAPRDLIRLILSDGARVMAIGGGIGLFLAAIVVRLSAGLAPGLPFVDMVAMVSVPAVLTIVILTACYLPARRASRVDPIDVLRGV
jgi:predicted permease